MLIVDRVRAGRQAVCRVGYAFLISAAIGLEREIRHTIAGLRTCTMVGVTALVLLVSG